MLLCGRLIFFALSVINLVTSRDLRILRHARDIKTHKECTRYYLNLIKSIAQKTTVRPADNELIKYCHSSRRALRSAVFVDDIDLDEVIRLYSTFPGVNSLSGLRNSPVETYGLLRVSDTEAVPVYIVADIRSEHLAPPNTRPGFRVDVERQMRLMGQMSTDERGHLLAHSLGGSSLANNIVPMAQNLNRHYDYTSYWRANEDWIHRFLTNYPTGRVDWRLAVHYEDDVYLNPNSYNSYRPISFTLQYTAYINQNDTEIEYYRTHVITYLNDNDYFCGYEHSFRRRRSLESTCDVKDPKHLNGFIGKLKSHGVWSQRYQVAFPFAIGGKHYFYAQSIIDGHNWFIQELLPNGQMGEETDHGFFKNNYDVVFPFYIKGRQFFYGHSTEDYNWFIQELLPGGKMGQEMSNGRWNQRYKVSFPYTLDGKYYFYGQSIIDGHNWFVQELLPNGQMGEEKSHGFWFGNYPVSFPYLINGRQFFYGQSHETKAWAIWELFSDGRISQRPISSGIWNQKYKVSFPFGCSGKHYFYGQSIIDGHNVFMQELLPTGEMGKETYHGFLEDNYDVAFPFQINGKQYFYGHSHSTKKYIIQEIL